MKKEALSIMIVKTLLAVIIFAGVGTIIVGGGYIIGEHSKCGENNKIMKPVNQEIAVLDVEKYLYGNVILHGVEMPLEAEYHAISAEEAILFVAQYLEKNGVEDIKIYHVFWSVAPIGQFYIAGECNFSREDKHYPKFLASIRDGSEVEDREPKVLFKGLDIWYSGLEFEMTEEFLVNYKIMAELYGASSIFEEKDKIVDWKIYNNSEVDFTFKYPDDWEIIHEYFYETAAGVKANNPTIILRKIGNNNTNDEIRITSRQFDCENGKCAEAIDYMTVGTYSKNLEVLDVFDKIIENFEKKDKIANWQTYRNEEYGFEVDYPEEWRHESYVMSEIFFQKFNKDSNEFICKFDIAMVVSEYFDKYIRDYYPNFYRGDEFKTGNNFVIKRDNSYFIKRGDEKKYSIHILTNIEKSILSKDGFKKIISVPFDDPECVKYFEKILSSFKFIDQSNTSD